MITNTLLFADKIIDCMQCLPVCNGQDVGSEHNICSMLPSYWTF